MVAANQPTQKTEVHYGAKTVDPVIDPEGDRLCGNLGGNAENFVPDV